MRDERRTTTQARRCKAEGRSARGAAGGHGERRVGGRGETDGRKAREGGDNRGGRVLHVGPPR